MQSTGVRGERRREMVGTRRGKLSVPPATNCSSLTRREFGDKKHTVHGESRLVYLTTELQREQGS